MKRIVIALFVAIVASLSMSAQKFALVDMDYILQSIPAYEVANQQLNVLSQRYQKEVEAVAKQAEDLYKNYQKEMVFLTDDQKKAKEAEIVAKEKSAAELRIKYFGNEGELAKKRSSLMQPIQDEVYNAIKQVSELRGYMCIFDRASSVDIIFASPRIDVSNEVLQILGYSK